MPLFHLSRRNTDGKLPLFLAAYSVACVHRKFSLNASHCSALAIVVAQRSASYFLFRGGPLCAVFSSSIPVIIHNVSGSTKKRLQLSMSARGEAVCGTACERAVPLKICHMPRPFRRNAECGQTEEYALHLHSTGRGRCAINASVSGRPLI